MSVSRRQAHLPRQGYCGISNAAELAACAKLCRGAEGELEQIQFLRGHVAAQKRYLGCTQNLGSPMIAWPCYRFHHWELQMWEGLERTDGLLRGSRDERIQQMFGLKDTGWKLDTLLDLHCGLLDHAHNVREAAMETLLDLAARKPDAIPITPEMLLAYYMGTFTVASGIGLAVVRCLAALHTTEADDLLFALLVSGRGSNVQFRLWLEILRDTDRQDILRRLHSEKLSPTRKTALNQVREA